jgi:hypothetical protein
MANTRKAPAARANRVMGKCVNFPVIPETEHCVAFAKI